MDARFIADLKYDALIEAILALEPDASTGTVTFDQIATTLGDFGNIWPEGIKTL